MTQGKQVEAVSVDNGLAAVLFEIAEDLGAQGHLWRANRIREGAHALASQSPLSVDEGRKAPLPEGSEELVERLRGKAQQVSDAHRMLAEAKSARQADRHDYPELGSSGYAWIEPEQTDEWKAADLIESLSQQLTLARLEAFEEAAKVAEKWPGAGWQVAKAIRALAKGG